MAEEIKNIFKERLQHMRLIKKLSRRENAKHRIRTNPQQLRERYLVS